MSIITILLALLLGSMNSSDVHLTSVSGSATSSPAGVYGGGPVSGPISGALVDGVAGGGPTI
jgi:hypothetical protein